LAQLSFDDRERVLVDEVYTMEEIDAADLDEEKEMIRSRRRLEKKA